MDETPNEALERRDGESVVEVKNLAKTFAIGFRRKRVEAVKDVSFSVKKGEVFGLIGPNGAGKTTTIKMMMGLVRPSQGSIEILGHAVPTRQSRARIGYLAEISYYYDYLKPEEILEFYGRLYGLDKGTVRKRVPEMLDRVGLTNAIGKPLRKFSKGMLQRIGLAQAIIADPDIVVLDEPQSGLDPIGRKAVADLIRELRNEGKTVFFSSHILPDVERICDRVGVMIHGKMVDIGPLNELLSAKTLQTDLATRTLTSEQTDALLAKFEDSHGMTVEHRPDGSHIVLSGDHEAQSVLRYLLEADIEVESMTPQRQHLEDVFAARAKEG